MRDISVIIAIFVHILFLVSIVESRRSIFFEDNEITNQSDHFIRMKFPEMNEILLKNRKMPRKRKSSTMVVPVPENCRTQLFQSKLKILRRKMKCKPRDTIVDLRSSKGGIMTPNAVVVKRCGGGTCITPKSCISLEKRNTTFYVQTLENKNRLVCNSIVVSEDVKCGCACDRSLKKCKPNQVYNQEACGCVCDNIEDFVNCMQNLNSNMHWDEKNCSCVCQQSSRSCTTGTLWISSECRCAKV